jgi:hypothetical protein
MSRSSSLLYALWGILAMVFMGYILIPVMKPDIVGTPAFWLFTVAGSLAFLIILFVLLYFIERGHMKK